MTYLSPNVCLIDFLLGPFHQSNPGLLIGENQLGKGSVAEWLLKVPWFHLLHLCFDLFPILNSL